MERARCISCHTPDLLFDKHEIDYTSCKLAKGKPCISCLEGIELSALISQTRETLEKLLSRREDLIKRINSRHDFTIHKFPPEVSAHIFQFALSENLPKSALDPKSADTSESWQLITTPLTLGAVCQAWRTIAWTSPRLWTMISIPAKQADRMEYVEDKDYLSIADDCLKRSGTLPVSIYIYTPLCARNRLDSIRGLSCIVKRYLHRCYHLEFFGRFGHLFEISGEAPLLDYVKISSDHPKPLSSDVSWQSEITFRSTKKNVRLLINNYPIQLVDLPWSNVNSLEGSFTLPECVSILRQCTNLTEFEIIGLKPGEDGRLWGSASTPAGSDRGPIDHQLERLVLGSTPHSSAAVLAVANLPSLTHLRVSGINPSSIRNFVFRSGCNLRYLYLNCDMARGLCDLLRSTNALEELHLEVRSTDDIQKDGLFSALASSPVTRQTYILPNLSTFTLRFGDETRVPWDLIAQGFGPPVDLRSPLRRPIKHFQVTYDWRLGTRNYVNIDIGDDLGPPTLFLSEEATRRFLDIAREGVNVDLQDLYAKEDILELAMRYHNIDVPEWYQKKNYVGIADLDELDFDYDSIMTDDSEDLEREAAEFAVHFAADFGTDSDVDLGQSDSDEEEGYRQFLLGCL